MAQPQTPETARRAILDVCKRHHVRAGDTLPVNACIAALVTTLQFKGSELADGKDLMVSLGEVEERDGGEFLTEAGYAAI